MKHLCTFIFLIGWCAVAPAQERKVVSTDMHCRACDSPDGKPGYAFLASAALPGTGQAANGQWWKTGLFLAVEATAVSVYLYKTHTGRTGRRRHARHADQKWSVVAYAQWLVENYNYEPDQVLNPEFQGKAIPDPQWDAAADQDVINIEALRSLERETPYASGFYFSHTLPDYGSQQYYELISKYYQFGPGWTDWDDPYAGRPMVADIDYMPGNWLEHARMGSRFNRDLSRARQMVALLIVNHFVAAFDAYFTHLLQNKRIGTRAFMRNGPGLRLTYKF
ncbi:MAG: DUF5683 domain-containing protein [Balneolales bacterium]